VVTARFGEGIVAGSDGCNSYQAAYTVDGKKLTIQPGISTMMACPEPVMAQATAYNQNLANAATYRIQGESLEIADAGGKTTLTYQAGVDSPAGSEWVATMINNGQGGLASVVAGTEVTAVFGEDGNLSGSAGCNTYNATYTAKDGTIEIGPAASTRKMCGEPQGVMEQETAYLTAISQSAKYELSGKTLTLRAADGSGLVTYTQK
jgi:heat shock protein HslJ